MLKEIKSLQDDALRCRNRLQQLTDIIKQLQGDTPNEFQFTFTIGKQKIISYEIGDDESNFTVGYFMSWHAFYSKKLRGIVDQLKAAGVPST